jgi:hypothetical protein
MVSVSALLALAKWFEARQKSVQEELPCVSSEPIQRQKNVKKRTRPRNCIESAVEGVRDRRPGRGIGSSNSDAKAGNESASKRLNRGRK